MDRGRREVHHSSSRARRSEERRVGKEGRDGWVTGVQTCALPISVTRLRASLARKRVTGGQQQHVARRHGLEQRPHLRAEQESVAGLNDVKRLDAKWIAGGEKFTIRQVEREDRKSVV